MDINTLTHARLHTHLIKIHISALSRILSHARMHAQNISFRISAPYFNQIPIMSLGRAYANETGAHRRQQKNANGKLKCQTQNEGKKHTHRGRKYDSHTKMELTSVEVMRCATTKGIDGYNTICV